MFILDNLGIILLYRLLEDQSALQTRRDVLQQTTGYRVETQLSAGHHIAVQQLEQIQDKSMQLYKYRPIPVCDPR